MTKEEERRAKEEATLKQLEILDGAGATVAPDVLELALAKFGLDTAEVLGLCAAPRSANVRGVWQDKEVVLDDGEKHPPGLKLFVSSQYIADGKENEFILFKDPLGAPSVYVALVDFKELPELKGISKAMTQRVAEQAAALKFIRLKMFAAGGRQSPPRNENGDRWKGYAAWPKVGFDMELTGTPEKDKGWAIHEQFQYAPPRLKDCLWVGDLLERELGADFWKVCGDGHYMEFELAAESLSWKRLQPVRKGVTPMKTTPDTQLDWDQAAQFAGSARVQVPSGEGQAAARRRLQPLTTATDDAAALTIRAKRTSGGTELAPGLWDE